MRKLVSFTILVAHFARVYSKTFCPTYLQSSLKSITCRWKHSAEKNPNWLENSCDKKTFCSSNSSCTENREDANINLKKKISSSVKQDPICLRSNVSARMRSATKGRHQSILFIKVLK